MSKEIIGHWSAEPLALLAGADDAYAMPLAVTLFSALEHLTPGRHVNVYIMDGGISNTNRQRIERVLRQPPVELRLEWVQLDLEIISALPIPPLAYHSVVINFRLFAPYLIPGSRVIYLDSDVVVRDDLEKIWSLDLKGCAVAAALDLQAPELGINIPNWQEQHLDPKRPYFNSGVLLIDLKYWRTENIVSALIENPKKHHKTYRMSDQDALNAILQNTWMDFGARWNAQINGIPFRSDPIPMDEIGVIHYTGDFKPWRWLGFGVVKPYYAQFFCALEHSRWFSTLEYRWFRVNHTFSSVKPIPGRLISRLRRITSN